MELLPRYLNVMVYRALLETATSEHASRMAAMDNATKNCKELVDQLNPGLQQGPPGCHHHRANGYHRRRRGSQIELTIFRFYMEACSL